MSASRRPRERSHAAMERARRVSAPYPQTGSRAEIAGEPFDPATIRAVAFDGYGTLFEFETGADEWYGELFDRWRVEDRQAFNSSIQASWEFAGPWAQHVDKDGNVDREHQLNGPLPEWHSTWEIWRRQYEIALRAHALTGEPEDGANYLREVLGRVNAYDDARGTLERLAGRGLRLGLLSNADEDFLQRAVSRARLRFSVIQSSESLRAYKPHRATFLALCACLGCAPSEILYVGDSPFHDVGGAINAGLRAAWIRRVGDDFQYPQDVPRADLEVKSLSAVAEALGA